MIISRLHIFLKTLLASGLASMLVVGIPLGVFALLYSMSDKANSSLAESIFTILSASILGALSGLMAGVFVAFPAVLLAQPLIMYGLKNEKTSVWWWIGIGAAFCFFYIPIFQYIIEDEFILLVGTYVLIPAGTLTGYFTWRSLKLSKRDIGS